MRDEMTQELSAGARVCEAVVPGGVREIVATI